MPSSVSGGYVLKKSVLLATATVLAAASPALATADRAKPAAPAPVPATSLPPGVPPTVAYQSGTAIHTPDGHVVNIPQATYSSSYVGQAGGRYVIYNGGSQNYYYTLLDNAGQSTPTGPAIPAGFPGAQLVGSGHLASWIAQTNGPKTLSFVDLATGAVQGATTLKLHTTPSLLHVGPEGVTYTPSVSHKERFQVRQLRANGKVRTLFTLHGGRTPLYVNPATNVVLARAKKGLAVSTARKPNTVRWVGKAQQAIALSPDSKRILLRGRKEANKGNLTVRRVSDGKVLSQFRFTTKVLPGQGVFENRDSFITIVRNDAFDDGSPVGDVRVVRCRVGGGCEQLPDAGGTPLSGGYLIPDNDEVPYYYPES